MNFTHAIDASKANNHEIKRIIDGSSFMTRVYNYAKYDMRNELKKYILMKSEPFFAPI